MQRFLSAHDSVLPLLLLALVLAAVLAGPVARALGATRWAGGALLLACLLPLALTLGPQLPLDLAAGRGCASFVRPYRWWGSGGEEVANALLLVPVGVLAPLLLRARTALGLLVLAAGFPWAVELTQYLLPWLGRECDLTDVLLNSGGLLAGGLVGVALALLRRRTARGLTRPATAPAPRPSASRGT